MRFQEAICKLAVFSWVRPELFSCGGNCDDEAICEVLRDIAEELARLKVLFGLLRVQLDQLGWHSRKIRKRITDETSPECEVVSV